jgi:lysophospholipase L1-like esterase
VQIKKIMQQTYLALGDSYTIGEGVALQDNFPNQVCALLQNKLAAPKIIAVTGHTTAELQQDIKDANLVGTTYNWVSLLIGVNNQYRGQPIATFTTEFAQLLLQAIQFANGHAAHVLVLSIPDWGVTPFAANKDTKKIAEEIDAHNLVCENISKTYGANFINITTQQRIHGATQAYLAPDGLHPSALEYKAWAAKIVALMHSYGL